ncbi:hypothetical protein TRAPUB_458 [Trametes pubescens]|uniref:Uncharacterized protein n=1 Tax=Trametes pubescens TaxID=154538 RepID=A0A1M2VM68_TRAPU|nr:hypothetical protein TRAPUB_458 [Trametes pubescens]
MSSESSGSDYPDIPSSDLEMLGDGDFSEEARGNTDYSSEAEPPAQSPLPSIRHQQELTRIECRWEERFSAVMERLDALDCVSGTTTRSIRNVEREQNLYNEHLKQVETEVASVRQEAHDLLQPVKLARTQAAGMRIKLSF